MSAADWAGELETVAVCVPDHVGRLAGKRIAATRLPAVLADGLPMPDFHLVTDLGNEPILGLTATGYHTGFRNGLLRPDPATLRRLPWDPSCGLVLADAYDGDGRLVEEACRTVLRRQVDRLAEAGLVASVATELEFYVFDESFREAHARGYRELRPLYHRRGDNDVLVTGYLDRFAAPLRQAMAELGIPAETTQGEGGVGQVEMNFPPRPPIAAADAHSVFKYATKALAYEHGLAVTFMAKLAADAPGSSCHVHISLCDDAGEPVTPDRDCPDRLSPVARRFLAGLLAHTPELAVLHAPHVNSYRRLQPDSWAPATVTWGVDNRTAMVRVVGSGPSLRLEFRTPGADANPYLSIAAVLAAGLGGIAADREPPPAAAGNAYDAGEPDLHLPLDLGAAVEGFAGSAFARAAFGDAVHRHVLGHARHELAAFRRAVTDWDRAMAFESV